METILLIENNITIKITIIITLIIIYNSVIKCS